MIFHASFRTILLERFTAKINEIKHSILNFFDLVKISTPQSIKIFLKLLMLAKRLCFGEAGRGWGVADVNLKRVGEGGRWGKGDGRGVQKKGTRREGSVGKERGQEERGEEERRGD